MMPDPSPATEEFSIGYGAHVGIVKPEDGFDPQHPMRWPEFVELVTDIEVSGSKTGSYICRPMGGDGSRSDANAQPWPLLPLDLDELMPQEMAQLEDWCAKQGLECVLVSTFSHSPSNPRFRLWVHASRPFTATEHLFLFRAFASQEFFPFKLDTAMAKPSQPIYLPRCPPDRQHESFARHYPGRRLDVDGLLRLHQEDMRQWEMRNQGARFVGKGVRVPGGTIETFNKHFDLHALLEAHGYKRRSRNRFCAPGSKSGRAAVTVYDWGLVSFHDPDHDPLAKRDELNRPRVLDPFAVYTVLEHHDDFMPAWKSAVSMSRAKGWTANDRSSEDIGGATGLADLGPDIKRAKDAFFECHVPNFLVADLLCERSSVIATGNSNSGKTTILEYLAICIVTGTMFNVHRTWQRPCLWIAGEDQLGAVLRIGGVCQEYGIDLNSALDQLWIMQQPIAVLDDKSMLAFHEGVASRVGPDAQFGAVFIDSKSVCWGGDDENSNDQNAEFMKEVSRHFAHAYGAATVTTHHLTKHKDEEEQSARGGGALINNADHEWRFVKAPTSDIVTMSPGAKLRIARWEPMRFSMKVVELAYPHTVTNNGPSRISVPAPATAYGAPIAQQQADIELAQIIFAVHSMNPREKRTPTNIARAMGRITDGCSRDDATKGRDWVRARLQKLIAQRLLDADHQTNKAGIEFAEQIAMESPDAFDIEASGPASDFEDPAARE